MTPLEFEVLAAVRAADEDEGGLALDGLDAESREALASLADGGWVEVLADEDSAWARITSRGVEALRDRDTS